MRQPSRRQICHRRPYWLLLYTYTFLVHMLMLSITSRALSFEQQAVRSFNSIGVVGGGLAGLSTAFHLLEKSSGNDVQVTILDKAHVGQGGASAVAGG